MSHNSTMRIRRAFVRTAGKVVQLKHEGAAQVGGGRRGRVTEFTSKSKGRMFQTILACEWSERQLALHLTYHWMPDSGARCKADLKAFRSRWERHFGTPRGLWKQEYQQRGVPHFHLVLEWPEGYTLGQVQAWVSEAWAGIVGQDEAHRLAGTRVEKVRSKRGVAGYLAGYFKEDKREQHRVPEGWWNGRWWGFWNVKPEWQEVELELNTWLRVRRVVLGVRRSRAKGRRKRYKVRRMAEGCWTWSEAPSRYLEAVKRLQGP